MIKLKIKKKYELKFNKMSVKNNLVKIIVLQKYDNI